MPVNPLSPLDLSNVQGDLPAQSAENLSNWWEKQQQASYQSGYGDPATGLPTGKALVEGLRSFANALQPGGPETAGAGIIAGKNALMADLDNAFRAKVSFSNPEKTWQQTGWWLGPDGKMKQEIPDDKAKLNFDDENGLLSFGGQVITPDRAKLSDVLDHPELYKNYPHLADTPVIPLPAEFEAKGATGARYPDGSIAMSSQLNSEDYMQTLLHEIQHSVQHTEGFATGGGPDQFLPKNFYQDHANTENAIVSYMTQLPGIKIGALKDALDSHALGQPLTNSQKDLISRANGVLGPDGLEDLHGHLIDRATNVYKQRKAFEDYQNLAGEVESRLVEARRSQGNYDQFPPATTGYPTAPQIVRFSDGTKGTMEAVDHDPFGGSQ